MGWSPPSSDIPAPAAAAAKWSPPSADLPSSADEPVPSSVEEAGGPGQGEALATVASGALASIPAGLTYLGTGGNVEKARAVQKALTYEPRTPEGQQLTGAMGEGMGVPGKWVEGQLNEIEPSGQLSAAVSDVAERAGYATAPLALAAPVSAIRRGLTTESTIRNFGRSEAPPKTTPGPITAEQLRTGPERLSTAAPESPAAAPATEAPVPVPVPGKPHIRPKAPREPAPTAAEAAARIRAEEGMEEPAPAGAPPAAAPATGLTAPARDEAEIASAAPGQAEQTGRLNAVRQLQSDTGAVMPSIRKSAVTGDYRETGTDYQLGELGDPTMRAQLDQENAALRAASQAQVDHAGGTARGVGQAALEQRGGVIDRALQGVGDWFDRQIRQTYQNADRAAGGVPMSKFDNLQGLLNDHSQFTGVEGKQLHADIAQVAQQFGMLGQDGFWKPTTVATAERFRQWLGEQYSPRIGRTIARAKDALDADVSAHGGTGLYDAGRALRFKRDQMLEGPTGISRLMPEKLPDGRMINRPVPLEKIADHVTNLPREQFDHIVNVLHDSAKLGRGELAENNAAALNEIRRHMAERLHEAGTGGRDGMWNPYDYHEQLDHYSTKLPSVFSPEGIRRFNTIHDAGNALRLNKRYPGAAKQIMQAGGLRALAAPRIAGLVEGTVSGFLGPGLAAAGEASGILPAARRGIERVVGGNPAAKQARQVGERLQPLSTGPGARQRGGPKFENNASGESAASLEAINRGTRDIVRVDKEGRVEPVMRDVTQVDQFARPGTVHVDRATGEITSRGSDLNAAQGVGIRNRAVGLGQLRIGASQRGGPKFTTMKMEPDDYDMLRKAVLMPPNATMRQRWDALHAAEANGRLPLSPSNTNPYRTFVNGLYAKGLNDEHIDTALRAISSQSLEGEKAPGKELAPLAARLPGQRGGPKFEREAETEKGGGATVNIGLHQGDPAAGGRVMKPGEAIAALRSQGLKVGKTTVSNAGSEPTLVADVHRPLTEPEMQSVLAKTKQSAIPQRLASGEGTMSIAPGHEKIAKEQGWDTYNPDYFRMHSGQTATEAHPVLGNLTDEERAQLRSHTTQRLMDAFHGLPATEEYSAAALAGSAKRGWYANSAKSIANVFGPDAPRFAGVLAAMSPQTSVEMNFHNALRTFVNWDKAGRPSDPAAIKQIMQDSVQKQAGGVGVLPAWENNTVRALTAEDPGNVKLSGPKVHSFYSNLTDKVNEVTNDAWMATFAKLGDVRKLGGSLNQSGPGKSSTYLAFSAKVRAAAKHLSSLTGETWTPREVQETVWSWAKTAFEHAEALGDKTIPELVKQHGITDELIRSTPDFHQLFDSPEHRGFLTGSRFAGNAKRLAGGEGEGANAAGPSKASKAASKNLRPHLLAAAERLERVRQERSAATNEEAPF